jgi:hypothetical protein
MSERTGAFLLCKFALAMRSACFKTTYGGWAGLARTIEAQNRLAIISPSISIGAPPTSTVARSDEHVFRRLRCNPSTAPTRTGSQVYNSNHTPTLIMIVIRSRRGCLTWDLRRNRCGCPLLILLVVDGESLINDRCGSDLVLRHCLESVSPRGLLLPRSPNVAPKPSRRSEPIPAPKPCTSTLTSPSARPTPSTSPTKYTSTPVRRTSYPAIVPPSKVVLEKVHTVCECRGRKRGHRG